MRTKGDNDDAALSRMFLMLAGTHEKRKAFLAAPLAIIDQHNADMAESLSGSLVWMSLTQLRTEGRILCWSP